SSEIVDRFDRRGLEAATRWPLGSDTGARAQGSETGARRLGADRRCRAAYTCADSTPRKRATLSTPAAKSPGVAAEWWLAPARHQRVHASTPSPWKRNAACGVPTAGQPVPVNSPRATT